MATESKMTTLELLTIIRQASAFLPFEKGDYDAFAGVESENPHISCFEHTHHGFITIVADGNSVQVYGENEDGIPLGMFEVHNIEA